MANKKIGRLVTRPQAGSNSGWDIGIIFLYSDAKSSLEPNHVYDVIDNGDGTISVSPVGKSACSDGVETTVKGLSWSADIGDVISFHSPMYTVDEYKNQTLKPDFPFISPTSNTNINDLIDMVHILIDQKPDSEEINEIMEILVNHFGEQDNVIRRINALRRFKMFQMKAKVTP